MSRLVAYAVLGFSLYKIFWDKPTSKPIEQPKVEGASGEEQKMNMTGFAYYDGKRVEGVNGLYFEGNTNFFD
jgi:hypothetical protein